MPLGVLGVAAILAVFVWAVVPGSLFELDGDTITGNQSPALDDWNLLNGTGVSSGCVTNTAGSPGGSIVRTFCSGANPPDIFTTGASKDPLDVTGWKWKPADTVPDKDSLTNGYAAEYLSGGSAVFVFGAERFATNGDSNIGIWFFQQDVHPVSGGTFSGAHQDGDIFAVSAFTAGGNFPTITVYQWDSLCLKAVKNPGVNDCAAANLRLKFASAAGSSCTTANEACAAVNAAGPITVSWPYAAKFGGSVNQVPTVGFFEGGIDIGALIPGGPPCFSSFLLETRSSQEPSAVLKDFISGSFDTCKVTIAKTCGCNLFTGSAFQYSASGTVKNDGVVTLSSVIVTDDAGTPGVPGDDLTFNCGSLTAGQTKNWPADCSPTSGTWTTTSTSVTNIASVTAQTSGGQTKTANTGSVQCASNSSGVCQTQPDLDVLKGCVVSLVQVAASNPSGPDQFLVAVKDHFQGVVTNTGNENLTNVVVSEDHDNNGVTNITSLPLTKFVGGVGIGAACGSPCTLAPTDTATFSGDYFPFKQIDVSGTPGSGRARFEDTVTASGTGVVSNTFKSKPKTASCVICPGPQNSSGQCTASAEPPLP